MSLEKLWIDKTPMNTPRCTVWWRDIRDCSDGDDVRPARRVQSLGWYLYEGPDPEEPESDIVVLGRTYDYEDAKWSDYAVFPRIAIKAVDSSAGV